MQQAAAAASLWAECDLLWVQMIRAADPQTRPQVLEILDSAQSLGLKVLRMWAFNEGPLQYNTLQKYPGAVLWPPRDHLCRYLIYLLLPLSWGALAALQAVLRGWHETAMAWCRRL